jgi:hypothetical protein
MTELETAQDIFDIIGYFINLDVTYSIFPAYNKYYQGFQGVT